MIEPLEMPEGTLGFRASGKVEKRDYTDVLVPALRERIDAGERMRILFQIGPEFEGYEASAMLADAKTGVELGIGKHSAWERTAIVTDVKWIRDGVGAFSWMVPGELRLFDLDQVEDAKAWVAG